MEDIKVIERFLEKRYLGSGSGFGSGYGNGIGYSAGNGDGFGGGNGSGFSNGYGYGAGASFGSGSSGGASFNNLNGNYNGYGYGDGFGYGGRFGSGYGDGDGDSNDLKQFCAEQVWYIDSIPTIIDQVKCDYVKGRIINKDLTTTSCYIARVDNSFAHGRTLKQAVAEAQAKALEFCPVEKKIERFKRAYPTLDSKDTCANFYNWHHILTGSCTMGRDQFVKENGLDMDKEYTVEYFLRITANSYGSKIIKQLRESYD